MLQICTEQYATVQYKAVRSRSAYNSTLQNCMQQYATRQYIKVCYRPDAKVCYSSVHNSMLLFTTVQYAGSVWANLIYFIII
jgi:hypothetical protein